MTLSMYNRIQIPSSWKYQIEATRSLDGSFEAKFKEQLVLESMWSPFPNSYVIPYTQLKPEIPKTFSFDLVKKEEKEKECYYFKDIKDPVFVIKKVKNVRSYFEAKITPSFDEENVTLAFSDKLYLKRKIKQTDGELVFTEYDDNKKIVLSTKTTLKSRIVKVKKEVVRKTAREYKYNLDTKKYDLVNVTKKEVCNKAFCDCCY